jgi:DNA-binding NarL/FixJ family response regulator
MADILFLIPPTQVIRSVCERFVQAGYQVDVACSLDAAEALMEEMSVDILLLDSLFCSGGEGIDFILKVKSRFPQMLIILSVCAEDQAMVYELLSVGIITSWIEDAFQNKDLISLVENILYRYSPPKDSELSLDLERQGSLDRRKSLRKKVTVSVRWHVLENLRQTAVSWGIFQTRNMSPRGLMFELDKKLDINQRVKLEICLPSLALAIKAGGQVRWIKWDAQHHKRQYGLQLMDLQEQDMIKLLGYLSAQ